MLAWNNFRFSTFYLPYKYPYPVMLTRTFHQGPEPRQGLHSQGPGQGPGFEYKDQDKDKDLSKCGHISVNIPGI